MSDDLTPEQKAEVDSLITDLLEVVRDGHARAGNAYSFVHGPKGGSQVTLKPMREAE